MKCIFCGKSAGFLRKNHKECKRKNVESTGKIVAAVENIQSEKNSLSTLEKHIDDIASVGFMSKDDEHEAIVLGWERAVEKAFDDGIIEIEEEEKLFEFQKHFSLTQEELDRSGAYAKMVEGSVLRDLLNGIIPQKINIEGVVLPFNLQKSEKIVWIFDNVDYYEQKTRITYVGGSQGFSVRVAKGLYYRTGAFKGERVQTSETEHVGTGIFAITNKHVYFSDPSKALRVAFNKIVTFEPLSDGIRFQRDAQTAKPQSFVTGDGWFTYNLVTNLAHM